MGISWKTAVKGVRYREHPTRKHGKRADRYWALQYKLRGKVINEAVGWWSDGHTQEEAEGYLRTLRQNWNSGEGPQTLAEIQNEGQAQRAEEARRDISLADYWTENYAPQAQQGKRPETWRGEERNMRFWLAPAVGHLPLRKIHPRDLETLRQKMVAEGKATRTIQHVLATLRAVWKHARRWGIVEGDCPAKGVELGRIDNGRVRFLDPAGVNELLEEVRRKDENAWRLCLMAAHTGARLGELAALRWAHVDLAGGHLTLVHTKTGKPRAFPMTPQVAAMLAEIGPGAASELVLTNADGNPWRSQPNAFRRAVAALGLNDGHTDAREKIVFHSLRHSAASLMLAGGVDARTIMELFGWSTLAMLQRYTHPGAEAKARAVAALGSALNAQPGKVVPFKRAGGQST